MSRSTFCSTSARRSMTGIIRSCTSMIVSSAVSRVSRFIGASYHDVQRLLSPKEAEHIGRRQPAHRVASVDGRRSDVRDDHYMFHLEETRIDVGFVLEYVESRSTKMPALQRIAQRRFVDKRAA